MVTILSSMVDCHFFPFFEHELQWTEMDKEHHIWHTMWGNSFEIVNMADYYCILSSEKKVYHSKSKLCMKNRLCQVNIVDRNAGKLYIVCEKIPFNEKKT